MTVTLSSILAFPSDSKIFISDVATPYWLGAWNKPPYPSKVSKQRLSFTESDFRFFCTITRGCYIDYNTFRMHYKSKKKKIDQQFVWKVKYAQWPPKELTVSFRIGDVDIKLQLTYRRRKKIWKRKTWSRTYYFIQKTIEMVIGSVGRDRSCYKIALLIRREWFPRLKIQQKRKWKLCD